MPVGPLLGHLWTLRPFLGHALRPPRAPVHERFAVRVPDRRHGEVTLRGRLSRQGSPTCVVLVHGLGGDVDSGYVVDFARAAFARGLDVLRLGLRGSEALGEDVYHAGIASDVAAALGSPVLAGHLDLWLIGFSLGGHVALRVATAAHDPRLRAVVAVGSPLDLARGATAIDEPARWPYRRHVLQSLQQLAVVLDRRGRLPSPLSEVRRVRTLRGWDDVVVAPRFGWESADAYYASESVSPRLRDLALPSLYVGARHDPMVTEPTVRPALATASGALDVRWVDRAGHVGFPPDLDLGEPGARGLAAQVLSWLERRSR